MTGKATSVLRVKHYKDRLVRARKARPCTVIGCATVIQPGEQYVDVDPPERMDGYFAQCVPCGLRRGYLARDNTDSSVSS